VSYEAAWRGSEIGRDLYPVRNGNPLWSKLGTYAGIALGGLDMWTNELFNVSLFGTLKHGNPDHACLKPLSEVTPKTYPKPDGKLTFDKLYGNEEAKSDPRFVINAQNCVHARPATSRTRRKISPGCRRKAAAGRII